MRTITVDTPVGAITGTEEDDGIRCFLSLPHVHYEAPFDDPSLATSLCSAGSPFDATRTHKDRTALSVYAPAGSAPGADAPVIAYIHGGSYIHGTHADPETQGRALAREGYVCVCLGYRLSAPGFTQLRGDGPSHYRGIEDCLLGLEWIQRCVESFGGDPTNVTLMGQSAGGGIVLWLLRKDHFRGGFRRAIALSPAYPRGSSAQRHGAVRTALGTPLLRRELNDLAREHPERLARRLPRVRYFFPTDVPFGPYPLEPSEWVSSVPLLLTCTDAEFWRHPVARRLDGRAAARPLARGLARHLGCDPDALSSYTAQLPEGHEIGEVIGDGTIRRYVAAGAELSPCPTWVLQHRSDPAAGEIITHCDDLPWYFEAEPSVWARRMLARFIASDSLPWTPYEAERDRAVLEVHGAGREEGHARSTLRKDPLGHIRGAYGVTR
ncbi:carboxylesterase family protein [Corynebacterium uropygiale]|uniref:Carboxylic ester hydrolase n=1 Tax=Corynebacterium uropygiale TaxID=1775911 RepID=A0A9X1QMR0_9CORY|nr:carboxylesterase family protein [Corynebacterium uropygiale]MCF4006177.1 carboxylesterase family protein [Corynebacterium uropygiale]